ncbi:hypothetical protein HanRHA438_Chr17g0824791 [Helianthus annuus]|nr:hypothetical protein HanRHA438_Chr17g0824791 [Helianthus annuus]
MLGICLISIVGFSLSNVSRYARSPTGSNSPSSRVGKPTNSSPNSSSQDGICSSISSSSILANGSSLASSLSSSSLQKSSSMGSGP